MAEGVVALGRLHVSAASADGVAAELRKFLGERGFPVADARKFYQHPQGPVDVRLDEGEFGPGTWHRDEYWWAEGTTHWLLLWADRYATLLQRFVGKIADNCYAPAAPLLGELVELQAEVVYMVDEAMHLHAMPHLIGPRWFARGHYYGELLDAHQ